MARPKLTDEDQFATDFDLKVIGHRLSASQITMKPTFTFGTARGLSATIFCPIRSNGRLVLEFLRRLASGAADRVGQGVISPLGRMNYSAHNERHTVAVSLFDLPGGN
jgi:hypothetical protein